MAAISQYESSKETPLDSALSRAQANKKDSLSREVAETQQRLGRLLLEGPLSPEVAAMVTLLIRKARDLHVEMIESQRPPRDPRDAPVFADL